MQTFEGWLKNQNVLTEADTRYSVEINFRTKTDEVLKAAAKITLGYVSAALKKAEFHVKQVFEEEPYRIMVSGRNWDDGEWVVIVSWNPKESCYVISKGFFNKLQKTVSKQGSEKLNAGNASEITSHVKNWMHHLKNVPDRHVQKLKKVPLKRGPK
jgi:PP-loop superfamily ATP-utilizing enzyme